MANEWGITDCGFYCPTYEEILDDKIKRAKSLFGEDMSVSELTPFGKYLRIEAKDDQRIYEMAEGLYYSVTPATATGASLERMGSWIGENKNTSVCAVHLVRIYGTQGYIIKAGQMLVRNSAGIIFYPVMDTVINNEETVQDGNTTYYADVIVQCTVAGTEGNTNSINSTVNINSDITGVSYLYQITEGRATESDAEYRARFEKIVQGMGTNTAAAIISEVMKIDGVHACIIKNNTTDGDITLSSKLSVLKDTYAIIIHADSKLSDEIAQAIFRKMPFGIRQSGLEVVTVEDDAGEMHNIKFTFVEEKRIDVNIRCSVSDEFEVSGIDEIRENISSYINSLAIGKTLIYSKLYECIHKVLGVEDVFELTVNGGKENISVSPMEIIKSGVVTIETAEV